MLAPGIFDRAFKGEYEWIKNHKDR
jgi:hypothetical protein